jgi:hypothetical protein
MADHEHIIVQVERGRARITLNRPAKRNALSFALLTELADALWDADDDKREFLKDVTALANTSGGHVIIGMAAVDGVATSLQPITTPSAAPALYSSSRARGPGTWLTAAPARIFLPRAWAHQS